MKDITVQFADGHEVNLSDRDVTPGDLPLSVRFLNAYRSGEIINVGGVPCRVTSLADEKPNTIRVSVRG